MNYNSGCMGSTTEDTLHLGQAAQLPVGRAKLNDLVELPRYSQGQDRG